MVAQAGREIGEFLEGREVEERRRVRRRRGFGEETASLRMILPELPRSGPLAA